MRHVDTPIFFLMKSQFSSHDFDVSFNSGRICLPFTLFSAHHLLCHYSVGDPHLDLLLVDDLYMNGLCKMNPAAC